jgi:hypothetical protein
MLCAMNKSHMVKISDKVNKNMKPSNFNLIKFQTKTDMPIGIKNSYSGDKQTLTVRKFFQISWTNYLNV